MFWAAAAHARPGRLASLRPASCCSSPSGNVCGARLACCPAPTPSDALLPAPQVGVFSATLPPEALEITRKFMNKPVGGASCIQ